MFVFGTTHIIATTVFTHEAWSGALHLGHDKGPLEWMQENRTKPVNIIAGAVVPPLLFMQDIILVKFLDFGSRLWDLTVHSSYIDLTLFIL